VAGSLLAPTLLRRFAPRTLLAGGLTVASVGLAVLVGMLLRAAPSPAAADGLEPAGTADRR
jgi:hypothetical protein